MKKLAIFLAVFGFIGFNAAAQDGLYVGGEFGVLDLTAGEKTMIIRPYIGYETLLADNALELFIEAGIPITMYDGETAIGIDLLLGGLYAVKLSAAAKLAFGLETYTFFPIDEKKGMITFNDPHSFTGSAGELKLLLVPNIIFSLARSFGDLYFGLRMPFVAVHEGDVFDWAHADFTLGVNLDGGVGLGFTLHNDISKNADDLITAADLFASYSTETVFAKITVGIPLVKDGVKHNGIRITPEFKFALDMGLLFYLEMPVYNIASDKATDEDIHVALKLGVKFSF